MLSSQATQKRGNALTPEQVFSSLSEKANSFVDQARRASVKTLRWVNSILTDAQYNATRVQKNDGKYEHSDVLSELAEKKWYIENLLLNNSKKHQKEIEEFLSFIDEIKGADWIKQDFEWWLLRMVQESWKFQEYKDYGWNKQLYVKDVFRNNQFEKKFNRADQFLRSCEENDYKFNQDAYIEFIDAIQHIDNEEHDLAA